MNSENEDLDCAICLQKCHHPTQLPCGHIFCFLCVKGIAIQSKKCAMCRTQIPSDYLDKPVLLEKTYTEEIMTGYEEDTYQWYYEGRNGWWKYDERSNIELEAAYNSRETECLLLLAGAIYSVDFQNMIQVRRNDRTRRRRVRRDVPTLPAKGIAGIKHFEDIRNEENTEISNDENSNNIDNENENQVIEIVDEEEYIVDNSETFPATPEDVIDLTNSFSYINLEEDSRDAPS